MPGGEMQIPGEVAESPSRSSTGESTEGCPSQEATDSGSPPDLSRLFIVAGIFSTFALQQANRLLRLAEATPDYEDATALAGATLVMAIAHLAQHTQFRLVQTLASAEADAGLTPTEFTIRHQLPPALAARVRLLPTFLADSHFCLDDRKEKAVHLLKAIRLRNQLVHEEPLHLIGSAEELDVAETDSEFVLRARKPRDPWQEVNLEFARFTVAAVQEFFKELDGLSEDSSVADSSFFRWSAPRNRDAQLRVVKP